MFYIENEQVAVADNFVASRLTSYQQIWGGTLRQRRCSGSLPKGLTHELFIKMLEFKGLKPDLNSMYLYKTHEQWFWPYDERGRLMREDILEPDRSKAEVIKLDPSDVLTAKRASELLAPLIKPLPSWDEMVLGKLPA